MLEGSDYANDLSEKLNRANKIKPTGKAKRTNAVKSIKLLSLGISEKEVDSELEERLGRVEEKAKTLKSQEKAEHSSAHRTIAKQSLGLGEKKETSEEENDRVQRADRILKNSPSQKSEAVAHKNTHKNILHEALGLTQKAVDTEQDEKLDRVWKVAEKERVKVQAKPKHRERNLIAKSAVGIEKKVNEDPKIDTMINRAEEAMTKLKVKEPEKTRKFVRKPSNRAQSPQKTVDIIDEDTDVSPLPTETKKVSVLSHSPDKKKNQANFKRGSIFSLTFGK